MSVNSKMTAIANAVRAKTGKTGTLTLDQMAEEIAGLEVGSGSEETVEQATPSITVSSGGLITATSTQKAGKVAAGTKTATKQLSVQAAQTITPSTTDKTIASGKYLTGTQTIKGDANLKSQNIVSGVSIFGVVGSAQTSSSGGGDSGNTELENCEVDIWNNTWGGAVFYTTLVNGTLQWMCETSDMNQVFDVLKDSLVVIYAPSNGSDATDGAIETADGSLDNAVLAYWVTGNGSIHIQ
jgi:hypothetical protein